MKVSSFNWYASRFPESLYPCFYPEYKQKIIEGYDRAANSSVIMCSLARDVESVLPYTLARVRALGKFFKSYAVIFYENDSVDKTKEILNQAMIDDPRIITINDNLQRIRHKQDTSLARTIDMAEYRNQYLEMVKNNFPNVDYVIVFDADIIGGWSNEGILNSLGYDLDVVGSNGIIYKNGRRLHYDSFAFRKLNHESKHPNEEINLIEYHRGEKPIRVFSCFGGLCIYKRETIHDNMKYLPHDCDHPTLHKQMREAGYNIYINPSQIVLYNEHQYCI